MDANELNTLREGVMGEQPIRFWAVDRLEGGVAVLVADNGDIVDVQLALLPAGISEGAVLAVPIVGGQPEWRTARVDLDEQERRLDVLRRRLDSLKRSDSGGDLVL